MRYNDQINLKLYTYSNGSFVQQAIIDDYQEISFSHNYYEAGDFTISINYNIPNAMKFERGMFVQFGNDPYMFGEIQSISDAIGSDGKGSQIRTITGKDARYILKRRVIKNMNDNGKWSMTAKGELCLRNLIKDQCGSGAETKRQLPISNVIPNESGAIGNVYSVSESFSNLYEVCKTIATQSEIGWRIEFDGTNLNLVCFNGTDRSTSVQFSTSYDSLANGTFTDTSESYANSIYVGGKGQNDDRDIYEGEVTGTPSGLDRFECWDNQSSMTTEDEYEAEALSMLTQYGQTVQLQGQGLAKCPYVYEEQYFVGDKITVAFSGKSAVVQILSVTERWAWNNYDIQFSFGKPQNNLSDQLQIMLRKIQEASNKTNSKDSIRWYTIPTELEMPKGDVTYNTIGFIGDASTGQTFKLYFDDTGTGSKTYHVYFKQLAGNGKLTLTTGVTGAQNLVLDTGTYVVIIYVDENGNIVNQASTPVSTPIVNSSQPITSGGIVQAIGSLELQRTQRGTAKDLSSYITDGTLWKRIAGTDGFSLFEDIHVGDTITMSRAITAKDSTVTGSNKLMIVDLDGMMGMGDSSKVNYHHLVMIPYGHFGNSVFSDVSPVVGGYANSYMRLSVLGEVATQGSTASTATINQQLYAEFGTHLKTVRDWLSQGFDENGNLTPSIGWYSDQACLMCDVELLGFSNKAELPNNFANIGNSLKQYSYFKQNGIEYISSVGSSRVGFFLRNFFSSTQIQRTSVNHLITNQNVASGAYYIIPRFVLA